MIGKIRGRVDPAELTRGRVDSRAELVSGRVDPLPKYLIVSLVFSHLGFWSGNLFLIAPFPDLCLLVPFEALSPPDFVHEQDTFIPLTQN